MIDLHCHIIPMVDDGAQSAEVACRMALHAVRSGVDTIVATPHANLDPDQPNLRGHRYDEFFSLFRALLRQHGIPLRLLPGTELFAHPNNLDWLLRDRRVVTLNHSRYLLTEFRFHSRGSEITAALDRITRYGYVPVVAHPERYTAVQNDARLAAQWFAKGYILQLNKGSLLGRLGAAAERSSHELLSLGLAHVIASDAHDTQYRPTGFVSLLPFLERRCAPEYIELLLETNPQHIIADEPIPVPDTYSDRRW